MKKILFVDTGKEYGGGTKSFLYLLHELVKDPTFQIFVHFETNYPVGKTTIKEIIHNSGATWVEAKTPQKKMGKLKKEFLRAISKTRLIQANYALHVQYAKHLLQQGSWEIVHLNNHFSENLAYIEAANQLNIRAIQHLRKNASIDPFKLAILKQQACTAICVSTSTFTFYQQMIPITKHVIYNPVEAVTEAPTQKQTSSISILMPANFLTLKGHHLVFEAFMHLKRNDICLIIAGNGRFQGETLTTYEHLKQRHLLIDKGFVEEMNPLYQEADYVLNFSENEGLPRTIIEGLSCGCGIIASDIPIEHELYALCSQKSHFHILERTPQALTHCLETLMPIPHKQKDEMIIQTFSLRQYVDSIKMLYKENE